MAAFHWWLLALQVIYLVAIILLGAETKNSSAAAQALPKCPDKCGNLTIQYPFGIGAGCSLRSEFAISCDNSTTPPTANLTNYNVSVTKIYLDAAELQISHAAALECYDSRGIVKRSDSHDLHLPPLHTISDTKNKIFVIGCESLGLFQMSVAGPGPGEKPTTMGFSVTLCDGLLSADQPTLPNSCSGVGCSQAPIAGGVGDLEISLSSLNRTTNDNQNGGWYYKDYPCSYAFLVHENMFTYSPNTSFRQLSDNSQLPVVVNWEVGDEPCDVAIKSKNYSCKANSKCVDRAIINQKPGYVCQCQGGYQGNPYLPDGCQDIDECATPSLNTCSNGRCQNTNGSHYCTCDSGYRNLNPKTCIRGTNDTVLKILLGVSLGSFGLLLLMFWIFCGVKRRKARKMRERFYKQNGGLLVRQRLASYNGSVDEAAIFSEQQIKTFTNNYTEKLGEGGFGIVYKGTLPGNNLPEDKKVVAVKISKLNASVVNSAQFANELILLSQVKHRNVLMLRGCCLETKTPILVYEYISQGTLHDHIHKIDGKEPLPWDVRLKIATGTAKALAYLHHSLAEPIIHRDVKSMNILLDKNFEAKISDFGASKLMEEDENQVATAVQGTQGYLDPEYTELGILTKKSDVYSFGVVLVELLTSKSTLVRKLADVFLLAVEEKRLNEILDPQIAKGGLGFPKSLDQVAELAKRCLAPTSNERPAMDNVAVELGDILVEVTGKPPAADEGGDDFKRSPIDTGRLHGSPPPDVDVEDYHRTMQHQSLAKPPQNGR